MSARSSRRLAWGLAALALSGVIEGSLWLRLPGGQP